MKKTALYIKTISITIVGLCIVQVVVSNMLSTTGITLSKIENQLKIYNEENAVLREKLLFKSSLLHIASNAASLGFVDSKSPYVLDTNIPIAIRQ